MKKGFIFVILLLGISLIACTPETAGNNSEGSSNNDDGSKNTEVVIALEEDAVTMLANTDVNSYNDFQISNIYDRLMERDAEGKLIPALATEWKSIDEYTWEFKLREDVKFHNGEPFNAEAVKYNIDYILDESNNSFYRARWTDFKGAEVIDDYTLHITTHIPLAELPTKVAGDLLIMEPGHLEEVGLEEAATNPVGTGPYMFEQWERDQFLTLVANEDYWKGEPSIKKVTFKYIPEVSASISALLNGEVDLIRRIPVDSIDQLETNENLKIETVSTVNFTYLALNTFYDGPLQDQKVRQAISYGIDVDELLNDVKSGYGTKMIGPLVEPNEGYTETKDYGYDPDKAIELLKEAGYEPSDLQLQLEVSGDNNQLDLQVAQAIASQLERIGIIVNVQNNEWGNHLARIRQRDIQDMFILDWIGSFTAQAVMENLFVKEQPYSAFYDEEVEQKIYKAIETFDVSTREEYFNELQHLIVDKAAWVPLWQQEEIYALDKNLNFKPRVDSKLMVYDMSW